MTAVARKRRELKKMVSQRDKDFLSGAGGRTVKDDKEKNLASEQTAGEHLLEIQRKAEEQKVEQEIIKSTFGVGGGKTPDDGMMKLAKETLDMQSATIKSSEEARKATLDALSKAELAKDTAQTQLYQFQLGSIKDADDRLRQAAAQVQSGGGQKVGMDAFKEIKAEFDKMVKETPHAEVAAQTGTSEATTVKLEQMKLDQQVLLFKLQGDSEQQKKEWDLKLKEFDEESKRRWAEYKDGREFKEKGLMGFSDLIGSISASVTKERMGGDAGGAVEGEVGEPVVKAKISSFPCQVCHAAIQVEQGETSVKCPNGECGATYDLEENPE